MTVLNHTWVFNGIMVTKDVTIIFVCFPSVSLPHVWGPYTDDCFASDYNKQLMRFHSRFYVPASQAIDTLTTG